MPLQSKSNFEIPSELSFYHSAVELCRQTKYTFTAFLPKGCAIRPAIPATHLDNQKIATSFRILPPGSAHLTEHNALSLSKEQAGGREVTKLKC